MENVIEQQKNELSLREVEALCREASENGERSAEYDAFVEKFQPKLTTDDCFTPPAVYEAAKNWAIEEYGWQGREIIRPFYPGGDFENTKYPAGCVVIDNPPFSIISKIVRFYASRGIDYFLFAPTLTLFSILGAKSRIVTDVRVKYANGAIVNTSFVASAGATIRSAPTLHKALDAANRKGGAKTKKLLVYEYPDELMTAARLRSFSRYGIEFEADGVMVRSLDAMKSLKKVYGNGYLISGAKAAEAKAAEAKAAEAKAAYRFELSARERDIVRALGREEAVGDEN